MAALPPSARRSRRGSLERPINARVYRGTWLLVAVPMLVAALSVARPAPLPAPSLPPTFDGNGAFELAKQFALDFPNRSPGSQGARGAAGWFEHRLRAVGLEVESRRFSASIPGRGRVPLVNVAGVVQGRLPDAIVVMAHRDNTGAGSGANDNASGTAALVELAREFTATTGTGPRPLGPVHTFVFLSTDGGSFGGLGADRFARDAADRAGQPIAAVVNLDAIAGRGRPRIELAGDRPRSPSRTLVQTAAARLLEQTGSAPSRPSAAGQLVDLAFPYSLYEQAPFVARGIPALTLTTAGSRPGPSFADSPIRLREGRMATLGRATQELLGSLDQGLELDTRSSSYVYFGARLVRGWAIELVLIAALLPFLIAAVDLYARSRRRRIPLGPALRSYRSRLFVWLWGGLLFVVLGLLGAWPDGAPRPLSPESQAAGHWPVLGLSLLGGGTAIGWLIARERLVPRRAASQEEEFAGHTAALLALGIVSLLVAATNPFALIFVLPSLHAWLWLPHVRSRAWWVRAALLAAGLAGPVMLLLSFATRFGLGFDAPWYVLSLVAVGYVPPPLPLIFLVWIAAATQIGALAAGRYAPYPALADRRPRGPVRELVRRLVLAARSRRAGRTDQEAQEV